MRDAKTYEKRIKKLLKNMPKAAKAGGEDNDAIKILIESVLAADSTRKQVSKALKSLDEEFVDYNELRVAQPKEIVEAVGKDFPAARQKADAIVSALNGVFNREYQVDISYMAEMTKRDIRRHLMELGLDIYAAARVTLLAFDGHAVPVDQDLADCLKMEQYIHPDSNLADVQGFLERVIPHKNAVAAEVFFRAYVDKSAKALEKYRRQIAAAEAKAKAQAEAEAKREAEEKAKQAKAKKAKKAKRAKKAKKAKKTKKASKARKTKKVKWTRKTKKTKKTKRTRKAKEKTKRAKKTKKTKKTSGSSKSRKK